MRATLLSSVLLVGFVGVAQADILSAGALYGSPAQTRAVCYVYNSGNAAIILNSFRITTQSGAAFALVANECGAFPAALAGGRSCGIAVVANNQAFNCRADVTPGKGPVRGVFEMRNASQVVLQNVEMR